MTSVPEASTARRSVRRLKVQSPTQPSDFYFFGLRIDLTHICRRKVRGSVSERPLHAVHGVASEGGRGISHTSPVSTRVRVTTAARFASKASIGISSVCLCLRLQTCNTHWPGWTPPRTRCPGLLDATDLNTPTARSRRRPARRHPGGLLVWLARRIEKARTPWSDHQTSLLGRAPSANLDRGPGVIRGMSANVLPGPLGGGRSNRLGGNNVSG